MTSSNGNIFRVTDHLCGEFTGEFPTRRLVTQSFDIFFDLRRNKRLSKQSWGWWFETLSPHYDVIIMFNTHFITFGIVLCFTGPVVIFAWAWSAKVLVEITLMIRVFSVPVYHYKFFEVRYITFYGSFHWHIICHCIMLGFLFVIIIRNRND